MSIDRSIVETMKKLFLLWLLLSSVAVAAPQYMRMQFNENVQLIISNMPCPDKLLKDKYPFAAGAARIDGATLKGCYTHEGDLIVIQWVDGDQTRIPADAFLAQLPKS